MNTQPIVESEGAAGKVVVCRCHRWLKRIGWGIVVLAVLYAVPWTVCKIKLSHARKAVLAAGRPTTISQIEPKRVADDKNAAIPYDAAVLLLRASVVDGTNLYDRFNACFRATNSLQKDVEIWRLLQDPSSQAALRLIEEGASRPACWRELDYSRGAEVQLPHLTHCRAVSRILAAKARLEAERGTSAEAWEALVVGFKHAEGLRTEPWLLSQLVRLAQDGIMLDTLEKVCRIAPVDEIQARRLDAFLKEMEEPLPLVMAMDCERLAFGEWVFRKMKKEPRAFIASFGFNYIFSDPPAYISVLGYLLAYSPMLPGDEARYIERLNAYARLMPVPYWKARDELESMDCNPSPAVFIVASLIEPGLGAVARKGACAQAKCRLARIALAAHLWKQSRGVYPDSLSELPIGSLEDPFTGKPFIYRPEGNGFVVYSIGANGKDDGGKAGKHDAEGDIVWRM